MIIRCCYLRQRRYAWYTTRAADWAVFQTECSSGNVLPTLSAPGCTGLSHHRQTIYVMQKRSDYLAFQSRLSNHFCHCSTFR